MKEEEGEGERKKNGVEHGMEFQKRIRLEVLEEAERIRKEVGKEEKAEETEGVQGESGGEAGLQGPVH